jgi:hypothetical protein
MHIHISLACEVFGYLHQFLSLYAIQVYMQPTKFKCILHYKRKKIILIHLNNFQVNLKNNF